jgi:hypothetical protein
MALEGFRGKTVLSGGSRVLWNFWSGWRVFGIKDGALAKYGIFSGICVDFLSVRRGLGPICNYFSGAEGPVVNFTNARGSW